MPHAYSKHTVNTQYTTTYTHSLTHTLSLSLSLSFISTHTHSLVLGSPTLFQHRKAWVQARLSTTEVKLLHRNIMYIEKFLLTMQLGRVCDSNET